MAQATGMQTTGWKRDGAPVVGCDTVHTTMDAVLAESDYVVSVLPSTAETRGLLGGEALAACSRERGAVLINVGRGDLLSEADLLHALDQGWIRQAILDVTPVEPLPGESELWSHPQVRITPHVSGLSFPEEVAGLFAENLALFLRGETMRYEIDWGRKY